MTVTIKVLDAKQEVASYRVKKGEVLDITAERNVNYQLINNKTGYAPQNILTERDGNDLVIYLEEMNNQQTIGKDTANTPSIIIRDYYSQDGVSNLVVGLHENGNLYAYIPESAQAVDAISMLAEEMIKPQVLGGSLLTTAAWVFNPWWIAGLVGGAALIALIAGGSGGNGDGGKENIVNPEQPTNITPPRLIEPAVDGVINKKGADGTLLSDVSGSITNPEEGDIAYLYSPDGSTIIATATVDPTTGKFTFENVPQLEHGKKYPVSVKDKAQNESSKVDAIGDQVAPDTITVTDVKNNFDENGKPVTSTIKGTAEPHSIVKVYKVDENGNVVNDENGNPIVLGSTTADADGNYTITTENEPLLNGQKHPVTATDKYGNESSADADIVSALGDTKAPDTITVTDVKNNFDENGKPVTSTIKGTAEPHSIVKVYKVDENGNVVNDENGNPIVLGSTTADADGNYTITTENEPLLNGQKHPVTATDKYGNESSADADIVSALGDTESPRQPEVTGVKNFVNDDGEDVSDVSAKINNPKEGDIAYLYDPEDPTGEPIASAVVDPTTGEFTFTEVPRLVDGVKYPVTVKDTYGNESPKAEAIGDETPPPKPIVESVTNGDADEDGNPDTLIAVKIPNGAEPGDVLTLTDAQGNPIAEPYTLTKEHFDLVDGQWVPKEDPILFEIEPTLANGNYKATLTDPAGNVSPEEPFKGDTIAPKKVIVNKVVNEHDENGTPIKSVITGTAGAAEPKSIVKVYDVDPTTGETKTDEKGNPIVIGSTVANDDGSYEITTEKALEDAKNHPVVSEDKHGNISEPADALGDRVPPTVNNDVKVVNNFDKDGNATSTTISGKAEPGSTVTLYDVDDQGNIDKTKPLGSVQADPRTGEFTITTDKPLETKDYPLVATDGYGNPNSETKAKGNNTGPDPVVVDKVVNQHDAFGNPIKSVVTGKPGAAEPNSPVKIYDVDPDTGEIIKDAQGNPVVIGETVAKDDGSFEITTSKALVHEKNYPVVQIDDYGNVSSTTDSKAQAPGDTVAPVPSDITVENTFTDGIATGSVVKGKAEKGDIVTVYDIDPVTGVIDKTKPLGSVQVTEDNGSFEIPVDKVLENAKNYPVIAKDSYNNEGTSVPAEGDTTPPPAPIIASVYNSKYTEADGKKTPVESKVGVKIPEGAKPGDVLTLKDSTGKEIADPLTLTEEHFDLVDGQYVPKEDPIVFTIDPALEDKAQYNATLTDPAGNVSEEAPFVGDHYAPPAPVVTKVVNTYNVDPETGHQDEYPIGSIITGKAEPGSVVTVYDRDENDDIKLVDGEPVVLGSTIADPVTGEFTVNTSKALENEKNYPLTATDSHRNESAKVHAPGDTEDPQPAVPVTLDDTVPIVDRVYPALVNNGKSQFNGNAPSKDTQMVYLKTKTGEILASATVDENGDYTLTVTDPLPEELRQDPDNPYILKEGKYEIVTEDRYLNESYPTEVDVDNTIPKSPTVRFKHDPNGGNTKVSGEVDLPATNEGRPVTVVLYKKNPDGTLEEITHARTDEDGNYGFDVGPNVIEDGVEYIVVSIDDHGNTSSLDPNSSDDPAGSIIGDRTEPTYAIEASISNTFENNDATTAPIGTIVSGKVGEPDPNKPRQELPTQLMLTDAYGAPVLGSDGKPVTTTVNPDGTFTFPEVNPALVNGKTYNIVGVDEQGNESAGAKVTGDEVHPDKPEFTANTAKDDNGNEVTQITATIEKNGRLALFDEDGKPLTDKNGDPIILTADASGNIDVKLDEKLPSGKYKAAQLDEAGNQSKDFGEAEIDSDAPQAPTFGNFTNNYENDTLVSTNVEVTPPADAKVGDTIKIYGAPDASGERPVIGEGTVEEEGKAITITTKTPLLETVDYHATVTDAAGNESPLSEKLNGDTTPPVVQITNFQNDNGNTAATHKGLVQGTTDAEVGRKVIIKDEDGNKIGEGKVAAGENGVNTFVAFTETTLETGKKYTAEISDEHNNPGRSTPVDGDNTPYKLTADSFTHHKDTAALVGTSDAPNGTVVTLYDTDGKTVIGTGTVQNGKYSIPLGDKKLETGKTYPVQISDGHNTTTATIDGDHTVDVPEVKASETDGSVTITPKENGDAQEFSVTYIDEKGIKHTFTVIKNADGKWVSSDKPNDIELDPDTGKVTIPQDSVKDQTDVTVTAIDEKGNTATDEAKADYDAMGDYSMKSNGYNGNDFNESGKTSIELPENALKVVIKYYDETGEYMHDETHEKSIANSKLRTLVLTRATDQDEWTWDVEAIKQANGEDYTQLAVFDPENGTYKVKTITEVTSNAGAKGSDYQYIFDESTQSFVDKPVSLGKGENESGTQVDMVYLPDTAVRGGSQIEVVATNKRNTEKGEAATTQTLDVELDNEVASDKNLENNARYHINDEGKLLIYWKFANDGVRNVGLKLTYKDSEEQVLYFHRLNPNPTTSQIIGVSDPLNLSADHLNQSGSNVYSRTQLFRQFGVRYSDWLEVNPMGLVRGAANYKLTEEGNYIKAQDYGIEVPTNDREFWTVFETDIRDNPVKYDDPFGMARNQQSFWKMDLSLLEQGSTLEFLSLSGNQANQGFFHKDSVAKTIEVPVNTYTLQDETLNLAEINNHGILDLSQVDGNVTNITTESLAANRAIIQLDNEDASRKALIIKGENGDKVDLSDEVIANGSQEVQYKGETYNAYTQDGISILISQSVDVY